MLLSTGATLFQRLMAVQKEEKDRDKNDTITRSPDNITPSLSQPPLLDDPLPPPQSPLDVKMLVNEVADHMRSMVDLLTATTATTTDPPPSSSAVPPPRKGAEASGVLSVDHMRAVYTGIELLWLAALKPAVMNRLSSFQEGNLSYPKTLVLSQDTMAAVVCRGGEQQQQSLFTIEDTWDLHTLVFDVIFCPSFSSTMQKRFIKRLILFQLLLSHTDEEYYPRCAAMTRSGLSHTVDEECFRQYVIAVRELMHESANTYSQSQSQGPGLYQSYQWLMHDCGRLLSAFIMYDGGLKYVLQGYLDGTFSGRDADVIQEKIAGTVTSVPSRVSKAEYYKLLCPQVMRLLLDGYQHKDNVLLQVCSKICNQLAVVSPVMLKRTILLPILRPLLSIGFTPEGGGDSVAAATNAVVVSTEADIDRAVLLPLQLLTAAPPSQPLLSLLIQSGYMYAVLSLHSFLATQGLSSWLMAPCSTLCKLLMERDPCLPGVSEQIQTALLVDTPNVFSSGDAGGVFIKVRDNDSGSNGSGECSADSDGLLGGIKKQLSALQSASSSELTKESFDQILSLCMEHYEVEKEAANNSIGIVEAEAADSGGRFGAGSDCRAPRQRQGQSVHIARALAIAHSLELLSGTDAEGRGKRSGPSSSSSLDKDSESSANNAGSLAMSNLLSDLFIKALSGYLCSPQSTATATTADQKSPATTVSSAKELERREQCSITLLALQGTLPMTMLLSDGLKIIEVLRVVLEAHAGRLLQSEVLAPMKPPSPSTHQPSAPTPPPLIQEISSSSSTPASEAESESERAYQCDGGDGEYGDNDAETELYGGHTADTAAADAENDKEFLSTSLSMLSTMLAFGTSARKEGEETALRSLLPFLQHIASLELDGSISEAATDVAVAIMTRGVPMKSSALLSSNILTPSPEHVSKIVDVTEGDVLNGTRTSADSVSGESGGAISLCVSSSMELLRDEHPAMRALGVRRINVALKELKTAISDREWDGAIGPLVNLLEDTDSFVYLSVVHTLRTLLDMNRKHGISIIMTLFESSDAWGEYIESNNVTASTPNPTPVNVPAAAPVNLVRRRVLLGESLMFGVRRAGEMVSMYASDIINGCLRVIRAENVRVKPVSSHIESWNVEKMKIIDAGPDHNKDSAEADTPLDTSCVSSSNSSSCSDDVDSASRVDSVLLRQSAVSLMAEVVAVAGYGASRYLQEVIQLASDVLAVEHSSTNAAIAMRRSAAFMIKHIVTGLQHKLFFMKDSGALLKTAYSRIKISCNDKDAIVRVHCQSALFALNTYTKQQLFFGEEGDGGLDPNIIPPIRILR